jgi:diguanylate cyclase (GGDEF)-like protein
LGDEVSRALRYGNPLSLVVADVDHFKRVNDTYGHPAGDEALRLAGTALRARSRRSDVVGRIGGDEFALLLPGVPLESALQYARRVFGPYGAGIELLTFSVGVASLDLTDPTADHLFRAADRALYDVKRARGQEFAVAAPSGEATQMRLDLEQGVA